MSENDPDKLDKAFSRFITWAAFGGLVLIPLLSAIAMLQPSPVIVAFVDIITAVALCIIIAGLARLIQLRGKVRITEPIIFSLPFHRTRGALELILHFVVAFGVLVCLLSLLYSIVEEDRASLAATLATLLGVGALELIALGLRHRRVQIIWLGGFILAAVVAAIYMDIFFG
jgi:hypothetical protein